MEVMETIGNIIWWAYLIACFWLVARGLPGFIKRWIKPPTGYRWGLMASLTAAQLLAGWLISPALWLPLICVAIHFIAGDLDFDAEPVEPSFSLDFGDRMPSNDDNKRTYKDKFYVSEYDATEAYLKDQRW